MKFILCVLFLLGHGVAALYFSHGRLALALEVAAGTWVGFLLLITLLKPGPKDADGADTQVSTPPVEAPIQQVFEPETVEQRSSAFPDIDEKDAATPDFMESGKPTQAFNADKPHSRQGSLF